MDYLNGKIGVLHVDDDSQQTQVMEDVLTDVAENVDVVTETTVDAGTAQLRDPDTDIECVVSDYAMPHKNGLDFLEAVREDYPDLPFILFTGKGSEQIASEAISADVTDYLQKGGMDAYRLLANRIENVVAKYRAEQEIQQVYEALEAAREAISLLDEDGQFTYVNQAYADLYGYEREEMLGEHWSLIYPDEEVQRVNEDILQAVSEGEKWHGETTGLREDGSTFIEDHTLVQRDDGGLICTVREVPE